MSDQSEHTLTILDPTSREIAHLFLPPDGTPISSEELKARVEQLIVAARELDRLRARQAEGVRS